MRTLFNILCLTLVLMWPANGGRNFVSASSQYAEVSMSPPNVPLTIAAWVRPSVTNVVQSVAVVGTGVSTRCQLYIDSTCKPTVVTVETGGGNTSATASNGTPINQWSHVAGVFASQTSRTAYLNGGSSGNNTTSRLMGTPDRIIIGARWNTSTLGGYFSGDIAEVGVWNVALSTDDLAALAAGAKPYRVRPDALVFYCPLWGQSSPAMNITGPAVTLNNSPATSTSHPRTY